MDPNKLLEDFFNYEASLNYFNLEISACRSTLVVNASKKGIEAFLNLYPDNPPETISFKGWHRPNRRWCSATIHEYLRRFPEDPIRYYAMPNRGNHDSLAEDLHIRLLPDNGERTIFCAGSNESGPFFFVNRKGWQIFLKALHYLKEQRYWFYTTSSSLYSGLNLQFELTEPFLGQRSEHHFKWMEFIRMEPYEDLYLKTSLDSRLEDELELDDFLRPYLYGNCSGYLLFSYWLHNFATSNEVVDEIMNSWTLSPQDHKKGMPPPNPVKIYLRKIENRISTPMFSFQFKNGSKDLHIFGNPAGFEELSGFIEWYAFTDDHEDCGESLPSPRIKGDFTKEIPQLEHFIKAWGWSVLGGAFFDYKYNPVNDMYLPKAIYEKNKENFIKDRLVLNDSSNP